MAEQPIVSEQGASPQFEVVFDDANTSLFHEKATRLVAGEGRPDLALSHSQWSKGAFSGERSVLTSPEGRGIYLGTTLSFSQDHIEETGGAYVNKRTARAMVKGLKKDGFRARLTTQQDGYRHIVLSKDEHAYAVALGYDSAQTEAKTDPRPRGYNYGITLAALDPDQAKRRFASRKQAKAPLQGVRLPEKEGMAGLVRGYAQALGSVVKSYCQASGTELPEKSLELKPDEQSFRPMSEQELAQAEFFGRGMFGFSPSAAPEKTG